MKEENQTKCNFIDRPPSFLSTSYLSLEKGGLSPPIEGIGKEGVIRQSYQFCVRGILWYLCPAIQLCMAAAYRKSARRSVWAQLCCF